MFHLRTFFEVWTKLINWGITLCQSFIYVNCYNARTKVCQPTMVQIVRCCQVHAACCSWQQHVFIVSIMLLVFEIYGLYDIVSSTAFWMDASCSLLFCPEDGGRSFLQNMCAGCLLSCSTRLYLGSSTGSTEGGSGWLQTVIQCGMLCIA